MEISYREPDNHDLLNIHKLFKDAIAGAFKQNNITDKEELAYEINEKSDRIDKYLNHQLKDSFFLIALDKTRIAGIAGIYPVKQLIMDNTNDISSHTLELGSVYIHPEYQKQGIAGNLVDRLIKRMASQGVGEYYLDCGYATSQEYWKRVFGKPIKTIENYFGENESYMIWKNKTVT